MTTWTERDLPVLRHVAANPEYLTIFATASLDNRGHPDLPGLGRVDVEYALDALREAGYVSASTRESHASGETSWIHLAATVRGRQVLREWPILAVAVSPTAFASLLASLQARAVDSDQAGALEEAARQLRELPADALRGAVVGVLATLAHSRLGL